VQFLDARSQIYKKIHSYPTLALNLKGMNHKVSMKYLWTGRHAWAFEQFYGVGRSGSWIHLEFWIGTSYSSSSDPDREWGIRLQPGPSYRIFIVVLLSNRYKLIHFNKLTKWNGANDTMMCRDLYLTVSVCKYFRACINHLAFLISSFYCVFSIQIHSSLWMISMKPCETRRK
jgi:hypothetical protein